MSSDLTKEQSATHYILVKPWGVYVKEAGFFREQNGHVEEWGREWQPVTADSIEAALAIGERQQKPEVWEWYRRRGQIQARPYRPGDEKNPRISISAADRERVQGLEGGMIARNPVNHDDQWYIAPSYFMEHYE